MRQDLESLKKDKVRMSEEFIKYSTSAAYS